MKLVCCLAIGLIVSVSAISGIAHHKQSDHLTITSSEIESQMAEKFALRDQFTEKGNYQNTLQVNR